MATAPKKAPAKRAAPKKHYIVTFDIDDNDPVAVFDTLEKAKKFSEALILKDSDAIYGLVGSYDWDEEDVEPASIKVYEGVLIGKPKVEVVFTK